MSRHHRLTRADMPEFVAALEAADGNVDSLTAEQVDDALTRYTGNWARNQYDNEGLSSLFGVPVEVWDADVEDGYEDFSGPRQVLYRIGSRIFCKDARNVSHHGWEWDEYSRVRVVIEKTVTRTVYS